MEFTLETELLDLETVIDHLGLAKFSLFGSSMSGPLAIAYTAHHPKRVTHLILNGTYADGKSLAKKEVQSSIISLIRASWGLGSKVIADIFIPGANTEELQSVARAQRQSASPEMAAKLLELGYTLDVTELLTTIDTPTLILHREGDKAVSIRHGRQLAAEIPSANFKVLKGNFHPPWYGEINEMVEEILGFVGNGESRIPFVDNLETSTPKKHVRDMHDIPANGLELVEQATIIFSDIVSSTDLVTRLGDAPARDIFLQHDGIIRNQIKKYDGRELQNLGDGFMLSFKSVSSAIKCACGIQKEISRNLGSIKVRMGINTGEVVRREGKHPFGQAVVIASRIASKAKGEQILVSDVTKHLTSGSRFTFVEKGRFKPKGFTETIKLHEVTWRK
jgi:class 3 adenylate cyclase